MDNVPESSAKKETTMTGTHGDLFHEIGRLVVAADAGEALDLAATTSQPIS